MIPEDLKRRFNMRTVYAVSRYDYILAFGFPCQVITIKFVAGIIYILCRDIFNSVVHTILLRKTTALVVFTPERITHIVVMVDPAGILTDTDDIEFSLKYIPVSLGDRIHTIAAPICRYGWGVNRIIEKIIPGSIISIEDMLQNVAI